MATAEQVLNWARSQIGKTGQEYWQRFRGDTFIDDYWTAWCAYFVSTGLDIFDVECPWFPNAYAPDQYDCPNEWINKYDLKPGDPVGFDWDDDFRGDHTGFVESVQDWGCVCIEGNTSGGKVDRKQRLWSVILGGLRPKYDSEIEQDPGPQKNSYGLHYRAHSQNAGWLPAVSDGQTAGTIGRSLRMEAFKITPPDGVVLDVFAHVQNIGTLGFPGIKKSVGSGTGSSDDDPIIGTVSRALRLEGLIIRVVSNTNPELQGKTLHYQVHVENEGWQDVRKDGEWAGTRGQSKRIEAIRMWFE